MNTIERNVTVFNLVKGYRRFVGKCCLHLQGIKVHGQKRNPYVVSILDIAVFDRIFEITIFL
jgi:hypothetical protein